MATSLNPHSTAQVAGHPIHPMLVPFPITFWVSTLVCDIVYMSTGNESWSVAAMWLLGAGVVMAALAAVIGFVDFLGERQIRTLRASWYHMVGNVTAEVIAIVNFYIRYADGAAGGVQTAGIWLSVVTVLLLLFNGWKGWEMVYRGHVGISD